MTVENTSPVEALESTQIDPEVSEGVDSPEGEESDSLAPEDDPNESFENWLKRQDETKKTPAKEVKADSKESKEPKNDPPKDENPPKEVKKEEIKSDKIKLKDKEYTPEELETSLAEAATIKEQHTTMQAQIKDLVQVLKTDPGQVLDKLEVNKDVIEQWYYKKYLEPELLTPEQRQANADREELNARRQQDDERRAKEDTVKKEKLKEQYRQEWSTRINAALEAANLPKSDLVVSRMGHHIKRAIDSGKANVQPADVIESVRQDLIELQKSTISGLAPEKLMETLGEDTMAKLRKLEADKYKQTKFENKAPTKGKSREVKKKQGKTYKSAYELLDDL